MVVVAGAMVKLPFDGFELGPPPQPAITSTRGTAQAKSERRKDFFLRVFLWPFVDEKARRVSVWPATEQGESLSRVIVTTIQGFSKLYVPGEVCQRS